MEESHPFVWNPIPEQDIHTPKEAGKYNCTTNILHSLTIDKFQFFVSFLLFFNILLLN